jgi:hypothetical protein
MGRAATEQTIFLSALEIADPAERTAYLDRACAGNEALRLQVAALLAAHAGDGDGQAQRLDFL